ncbi:transcriptional regulator [Serratia quinivorans]|uniref:transcriptional regulator n=1 Tax=Serratia quinivorans TaxID=137545 RepID=UPI0021B728D6|nr:transcriptional regulator [Serratia quinivorans]
MSSPEKQTIRAQIPVEFTDAAEELAIEMDSSIRRHQQVLTGLADVDKGRKVSRADMLDFIARLKKAE